MNTNNQGTYTPPRKYEPEKKDENDKNGREYKREDKSNENFKKEPKKESDNKESQ